MNVRIENSSLGREEFNELPNKKKIEEEKGLLFEGEVFDDQKKPEETEEASQEKIFPEKKTTDVFFIKAILEEIKRDVVALLVKFGDILPEWNYFSFSAWIIFIPQFLREISSTIVLPQSPVLGPLWNYLDAVCAGIIGIKQLYDELFWEHHRPVVIGLKGKANIANFFQLAALTYVNFAIFGGPAFAACFGISFIISFDELACSIRRFFDLQYWFKDNLKELDHLNERLILKLETEIRELKTIGNPGTITKWLLGRKENRLQKLQERKKELEEDIACRVSSGKCQLKDTSDYGEETRGFLTKLQNGEINFSQDREAKIKEDSIDRMKNAGIDTLIWGTAFTGMLLICFATPGLQTLGFVIIGVASFFYIIRNFVRIKNACVSLYHGNTEKPSLPSENEEPDFSHNNVQEYAEVIEDDDIVENKADESEDDEYLTPWKQTKPVFVSKRRYCFLSSCCSAENSTSNEEARDIPLVSMT